MNKSSPIEDCVCEQRDPVTIVGRCAVDGRRIDVAAHGDSGVWLTDADSGVDIGAVHYVWNDHRQPRCTVSPTLAWAQTRRDKLTAAVLAVCPAAPPHCPAPPPEPAFPPAREPQTARLPVVHFSNAPHDARSCEADHLPAPAVGVATCLEAAV